MKNVVSLFGEILPRKKSRLNQVGIFSFPLDKMRILYIINIYNINDRRAAIGHHHPQYR